MREIDAHLLHSDDDDDDMRVTDPPHVRAHAASAAESIYLATIVNAPNSKARRRISALSFFVSSTTNDRISCSSMLFIDAIEFEFNASVAAFKIALISAGGREINP